MLFNSLNYAVFLPIVFILYWLLPEKFRWVLLLISSYYFYMSWNAKYVVLILFTTCVSYGAARLLEKTEDKTIKKGILTTALVLCLGVLFIFKYFNFSMALLTDIFSLISIKLNPVTLSLLLPVGISFYTFQTLSYVIDVYKGDIEAEKHFGLYAVYVSFFPQLVAGPIERTKSLLPQLKEKHDFDYSQATYGLKLMAWGFFKKLVVADNVAKYVSAVYDNPTQHEGFSLVLASVFFTIQIYCDFSGYSDIAIGTAKLLGINLMTNFKSPYFSQSVKEFWSRWHISLSTWFRDYVYIPLGGNRKGKAKRDKNLLITFLVSGLWHGADLSFVAWGGIHGLAQVIENHLLPKKYARSEGLVYWLRVGLVFIFATFAWIFFVADNISDAVYVITHMFVGIGDFGSYIACGVADISLAMSMLIRILASVLLLAIYDFYSLKLDCIDWVSEKPFIIRHMIYILLIAIIIMFRSTGAAEFVYFQF